MRTIYKNSVLDLLCMLTCTNMATVRISEVMSDKLKETGICANKLCTEINN